MSRTICLFYSLSFFRLWRHEEHCENMKKLVPYGKFFLCVCECDGLMNGLLHPWVLFLSCDGGPGLLSADSQRNSYQAETSSIVSTRLVLWVWTGQRKQCGRQVAFLWASPGFWHPLGASVARKNPKKGEWDAVPLIRRGWGWEANRRMCQHEWGQVSINITVERCLGGFLQSLWSTLFLN